MSLTLNRKRKTYNINYKKDDIDITFRCCILNTREINDLIKTHTSVIWDSPDENTPKIRIVEPTDTFKFSMDSFCKTIESWEGVNKEDGSPQECSDDAKTILYDNYPEIGNFITSEIRKIKKALMLEAEELEKN